MSRFISRPLLYLSVVFGGLALIAALQVCIALGLYAFGVARDDLVPFSGLIMLAVIAIGFGVFDAMEDRP